MAEIERVCGTCECHEEFSGACFNGRSNKCAEFTAETDTCASWRKKEKATNRDYKRMLERREKTEEIIKKRPVGKYCETCARFERIPETKAAGWCPVPKIRGRTPHDGPKKYVLQSRMACRHYIDKEEANGAMVEGSSESRV